MRWVHREFEGQVGKSATVQLNLEQKIQRREHQGDQRRRPKSSEFTNQMKGGNKRHDMIGP